MTIIVVVRPVDQWWLVAKDDEVRGTEVSRASNEENAEEK